MNKKSFVRTLEMILVITLIFGMYTLLYTQVFHVAKGLELNPTRVTDSFLDRITPYITNDIENYDLGSIESVISNNLAENNIFERTVLKYSTFIAQVSPGGEYVFSYNFPDYTDSNSINVYGEGSYDRNVVWSWYRVPLTVHSNKALKDVNIHLELDIPSGIDKETFIFYYNEKKMKIYLEEFTDLGDRISVKIIARIPDLKQGSIESYLYFSEGSYYKSDYTIFYGANSMNITYYDVESAPRADVFFAPTSHEVYLSYSMSSEEPNTYNTTLTKASLLNVKSPFKKGTISQKVRTIPKDYTISERTIWYPDKSATIKVYTWSI